MTEKILRKPLLGPVLNDWYVPPFKEIGGEGKSVAELHTQEQNEYRLTRGKKPTRKFQGTRQKKGKKETEVKKLDWKTWEKMVGRTL